jgi:hypothetical protein
MPVRSRWLQRRSLATYAFVMNGKALRFALGLRGGVMPFKSEAQRRYFEANKSKLEKQGVDVEEWEQASKGMKLPERAPKKATKKKKGSRLVNASA